jgi:hypothetical protein
VHLRAPLHAFYGGHLLQLGRGEAFDRVIELVCEGGSDAERERASTSTRD